MSCFVGFDLHVAQLSSSLASFSFSFSCVNILIIKVEPRPHLVASPPLPYNFVWVVNCEMYRELFVREQELFVSIYACIFVSIYAGILLHGLVFFFRGK